jgi:magnesium transporter
MPGTASSDGATKADAARTDAEAPADARAAGAGTIAAPACLVDSALYVAGRRARDVPVGAIGDCLGRADGLLWIGLRDPDAQTLLDVASALEVGPKAIEEIAQPHRKPKVIDYGNAVLVVAITVELKGDRPALGETELVIGHNFLLTVRRGAVAGHVDLRARLEAAPELIARGSDFVASELLDLLVDRYVGTATGLEAVVDELEQKLLLRGLKDADIRRLYRLRRDLLRIHGAVAPLAEICRRLSRVEVTAIDAAAKPFFLEVADRVQRVDEAFGAQRETLAFAFEASLMIGQTQQNETTRRLAAWAAILAVPTALAGIYGMNFDVMPELKWAYGYPAVLAIIVAVCSYLYWRFRRAGWL